MKYEDNFLKPRPSENIAHHDKEEMEKTGLSYVLLDNKHFPGADLRITTRRISNVPENADSYVELHTHDVDQVFVFLSGPKGTEPLSIEFVFEDETYSVESPVTVFVPKGVPHSQRVVSGSGRLVTLLKKGEYP